MEANVIFLAMAVPSLAFGAARLFFPEQVFYFHEHLRYECPPEPSRFKLWSLRVSGLLLSFTGLAFAWLGIAG